MRGRADEDVSETDGGEMMTEKELQNMWYYFLDLDRELSDSSRYIEPDGQEKVYSFEFRKIIILACTECETAFKAICESIDDTQNRGSIADYKKVILGKYPKIVNAEVNIKRWHRNVKPFAEWDTRKLSWWTANQNIKHDRGANFDQATYENATYALSALYILVFYLFAINNQDMPYEWGYIDSEYGMPTLLCQPNKKLPDFE